MAYCVVGWIYSLARSNHNSCSKLINTRNRLEFWNLWRIARNRPITRYWIYLFWRTYFSQGFEIRSNLVFFTVMEIVCTKPVVGFHLLARDFFKVLRTASVWLSTHWNSKFFLKVLFIALSLLSQYNDFKVIKFFFGACNIKYVTSANNSQTHSIPSWPTTQSYL